MARQTRRELFQWLREHPEWRKASMMHLGAWCQALGMTGRGSRQELTDRIATFLLLDHLFGKDNGND